MPPRTVRRMRSAPRSRVLIRVALSNERMPFASGSPWHDWQCSVKHGRGAALLPAAAGLAERVEAGLIGGAHVQHAGGRIGGAASPIRSAELAGNRDLVAAERQRREESLVARFENDLAEALPLRGVHVGVDVVRAEAQARERRRLGGKRLRGPRLLAGHIALGNRPLFDGPERLAGHAVEDVEQSELGGLRDDVDHLAVVLDGEELGRGGGVVVPEIVMDELVMPEALAGAEVEREDAVAEEIGAFAVAAVHVVSGRAEREIADAALLIDRDFAPGIDAADVRPGVLAATCRSRARRGAGWCGRSRASLPVTTS